uniref:Uncharacterized protein n=1 Tax=Ditylenchus dipsaci TaxID=166011 RepID=A0A915E6B0_9BILA
MMTAANRGKKVDYCYRKDGSRDAHHQVPKTADSHCYEMDVHDGKKRKDGTEESTYSLRRMPKPTSARTGLSQKYSAAISDC